MLLAKKEPRAKYTKVSEVKGSLLGTSKWCTVITSMQVHLCNFHGFRCAVDWVFYSVTLSPTRTSFGKALCVSPQHLIVLSSLKQPNNQELVPTRVGFSRKTKVEDLLSATLARLAVIQNTVMGKLSSASAAVDGSDESKGLARSARRSSSNIAQHVFSYRQAARRPSSLWTKTLSFDRALVAAKKLNVLKTTPKSFRHCIFVSSTAWQQTKKSDDTPPLKPRRPNLEIEEALIEDSDYHAPPGMPHRKASTDHMMMMNASIPTRKVSLQDYTKLASLGTTSAALVMPIRKASCDTMFPETGNSTDYCSTLSNQRNAVFGQVSTKPRRLTSVWDTLLRDSTAPLKQDKAPSSYQRKVSVSEISNFANIHITSRSNLQSMASPPTSISPSLSYTESESSLSLSLSNSASICDVEETWAWIQRDCYALVACQHCQTELTCIRHAAQVQCRQCHTLTPNTNRTGHDESETITGVGLTLQDLRQLEEQGAVSVAGDTDSACKE